MTLDKLILTRNQGELENVIGREEGDDEKGIGIRLEDVKRLVFPPKTKLITR